MSEVMSNKDNKIFADKIRMIAKSIYESADDIAGNTEGCIDISVSFTIETNGIDADIPTYDVTRTHYPKRKLLEDYIFGKGESHN